MKNWQIIDLVRTFCVIAVLGVHFYSNIPFNNPWICWLWGRFCINGKYGVFLFFVVSGFLITNVIAHNRGGLSKPSLRQFYVQRIGRTWPLFYLCFLMGLVVFVAAPKDSFAYRTYFVPGGNYGPWFWLSIPTFMFNWFLVAKPNWNYAAQWILLWSLCIEEQFYFLYPFALKKLGTQRALVIFLFTIISLALLLRIVFFFYGGNDFLQTYPFNYMFDLIAMGVLLFLVCRRYKAFLAKNRKISMFLCAGGGLLTLAVYFVCRENSRFDEIFSADLLGLGVALFLLGGFHLPLFDSPYWRILALPGKYCYGCYLLHPIVLLLFGDFLHGLYVFTGFLLYIFLTTLISACSFHFFECPVKLWFRGKFATVSAPL